MVSAVHVQAPSAVICFKTGILLFWMTAGLPPSMLMMKTCSARGAAETFSDRTNTAARTPINGRKEAAHRKKRKSARGGRTLFIGPSLWPEDGMSTLRSPHIPESAGVFVLRTL